MIASLEAGLARSTGELWEELDRLGKRAANNKARMEELRSHRHERCSQACSAATSPIPSGERGQPEGSCDASTQASDGESWEPQREAARKSVNEELQALRAGMKKMAEECEALRKQVADAKSEAADEKFFTSCVEQALDEQTTQQKKAQAELAKLKAEREAIQEGAAPNRDEENQELLAQNRELMLTIQMFKQECETLNAENKTLRESVSAFEENLDRVTSQNAKLLGHSNHRQKIHYTFKLKEENGKLRDELRKTQQKLLQMQGNRRGQDLVAAFAPFSVESRQGRRSVPNLAMAASLGAGAPASSGAAPGVPSACAARQARPSVRGAVMAEERILERVSLDFQHFTALIGRAISAGGEDEPLGACSDVAALLAQLRGVVSRCGPRLHP
mmetsp:Transcript_117219/g.338897  ORF Transcript_117219/g.338897 Transcript_117219/m.338897 type:complete len:390 (+) Transcript_117219:319-1488(+)